MDHATILAKVVELVAENLEADEASITEDTRYDDLGADSFDLLELVTAMEDEFDLTLDDDSLAEIQTVGDTVSAIENA